MRTGLALVTLAPSRAVATAFWLVHINTYGINTWSIPPCFPLTSVRPCVHTIQSNAFHIHWLSQSLAVPRDLCPLHRCGDQDPEREGTLFPDCCRVLVLGVCPQPLAGSHWTSHESPTHPGRVWHLLGTGGFAELRAQPWALKLESPVVVDSVCTVIRMVLVPPLPETALFPKLGCCP